MAHHQLPPSPSRDSSNPTTPTKKKLSTMVARWASKKPAASRSITSSESTTSSPSSPPQQYEPKPEPTPTPDDNNNKTLPSAHAALQPIYQWPPPQHTMIPRSSVSSDISSSTASKSTITSAPSAPSVSPSSSYDIHPWPPFRKNVHTYLGMPLSSTYEEDAAWSPPPSGDGASSLFFFPPDHVSLPRPSSHDRDRRRASSSAAKKTPVRDPRRLPVFAFSPADKIFIDPTELRESTTTTTTTPAPAVDLVRTHLLPSGKDKGSEKSHANTVYAVDVSHTGPTTTTTIASKHGDKTLRIHTLLPQNTTTPTTTTTPPSSSSSSHIIIIKVSFYIQMQPRSRDFFVTSHAILSSPDVSRTLVAIATGFGQTLEIWDWARRKRLQTLPGVYRWAATAAPDTTLACYREEDDTIALYHPSQPSSPSNPPFGPPTIIDLTTTHLPHLPKLPELALSPTSPLLLLAAGPRPPRTGHPPPAHGALLMAWDLRGAPPHRRPWRATHCAQLRNALPCGLATSGTLAVSIWIPHSVRVIGSRAGGWQVEPVGEAGAAWRWVLVWDFEGGGEGAEGNGGKGKTTVFAIPNGERMLACVSPDCRWVAYREGPGKGEGGCLVILDVARGGREVWRTPRRGNGGCRMERDCGQLMDLSRITSISFSADGDRFLIGDVSGSVGVYEVRTGGEGDGGGFGVVLESGWEREY